MQHVLFPLSVFTLIIAAVVATARLFDALAKLLRALIELYSAIRRRRKAATRSRGSHPVERDQPTATIKVSSPKPRRRLRPVRDRVGPIRRRRKAATRSRGSHPVERDQPTATKVSSPKLRRRVRPVRDRVGRSITHQYRWPATWLEHRRHSRQQ
jgi:hypothetical protein